MNTVFQTCFRYKGADKDLYKYNQLYSGSGRKLEENIK